MSNVVHLRPDTRATADARGMVGALIARVRQLRGGDRVAATRPESIAALAAAFTNGIPPETVEVYLRALTDVPPEELQDVVEHLIETQEERWLPTVATLRRMVFERRLALPSPAEAWALVQDETYRKTRMPAPVREALEALGGSWALRQTDSPSYFRTSFIQQYTDARRRALDEASSASRAQLLPARVRGELGGGDSAA